MNITVFGGSHPKPGDPAYEEALRLGKSLAQAGFTVMTGGYIGTMEAVSRGAAEAGGNVIGLTCDEIENWRQVRPNRWVLQESRYKSLRERLMALVETCDAAIALPGGVGTLAEVSVMWNHLLTEAITPRPLILIGPGWRAVIDQFLAEFDDYVAMVHRQWVQFAQDTDEAVALLDQYKAGQWIAYHRPGETKHA